MSVLDRLRSDDRGAGYVAAFIVLLSVLLGAGVSALADAGRVSAAQRHSSTIAYEAARVGAQEISLSGGTIELNADAARTAAAAAAINLASDSDAQLDGARVAGNEVIVTITFVVDRWFPGFGPVTVIEEGRAQFTTGIVEEGQ